MTSFLSGQNSGFEGGIGTWTGAGNCNVAATSAQAHAGTGALQMTSVASGNMDAAHCTAANILTQGLACASGNTISLSAWFRSAVSTRNCQVGATFYTSGGVLISTLLAAGGVTSSTTGWTQVTGTVTAPATSAFCRLDLRVNATGAANEVHYADDAAISNNSTLTQWYAGGPSGTGGEPCNPGDTVSAAADVYTPAALGALALHIDFYVAAGTYLSSISPATVATAAGDVTTVKATGTVPATAAFLRCTVIDIEASAAGTLMYADHVRITPRMGPQTAKEYHHFLQEIETLDQGILTEDRTTWGLGLRTRFSLVAQAPAVTLDYNMLSPPLEPVVDDQRTVNDVILKRHKGSQVRITNTDASSPMNIQPPPIGVDKKVSITKVIAESDAQLLRLAQHLLNLGTVTDERFPTVTVNLARAGIAGNAMAPLMPAIAAVEVGDRIQATGLPFYYPSATLDQMVIGYQERINPREWVITWNCIPQSPFSLSATTSGRW